MNLHQVAKRARVSTATVSRVLSGTTPVTPSTKARVLKAVEALKYHPNLNASNLARGTNRAIGFIASNMGNPFFFDIYRTLEQDAHARGYEVFLANTDYRSEQLASSVHLMIGRRVAGLAVVVSEMYEGLTDELHASGIPVVFFDVGAPRANITTIRVNYQSGITKLVGYLHRLGHRRIGFLGHHAILGPIYERMAAVFNAVSQFPSLEVSSAANADTLDGGREAMRALLATGFSPTGVICVNDLTAIGALRELRERGIRVPQDISVTGFDNITLSEYCSPALTTVHVPRDLIGHVICERLIPSPKESGAKQNPIVIDPEFVVRDSTGPARKAAAPTR